MNYFLCKLIPPGSTFAEDMSEVERNVMRQHVAYWTGLAERGVAVAFGPVLDPAGVWGVAIIKANDEREAHALFARDPAMSINRLEIYPMGAAVVRR